MHTNQSTDSKFPNQKKYFCDDSIQHSLTGIISPTVLEPKQVGIFAVQIMIRLHKNMQSDL